MKLDDATRKRWLWIGGFVALWTVLGLVSSIQVYVAQMVWDKPVTWGLAFRRSFKEYYSYALIAAGILWFCRRWPLEPGRTSRWVMGHMGAAVLSSVAYLALFSALLAGERSVQTGETLTFSVLFQKMAVHYLVMDIIMYWIVVCCFMAWHYYRRYREREMLAAELQRELVEARLAALRMQLNPHFLFNTLHAVSALIHENPEAADRVVARLSELLRLSLDQSKPQEVPLHEELAFLDRYLEIEQTRFADRLTIEKQIEPGVRDALVPFLILQPLVENAIQHGIEPREDAGRLGISARRDNGKLEIRVSDNGAGLPEGRGGQGGSGIGLANTRSRLQHLYGDDGRLDLVPAQGGGLEARMVIPFHASASAT